MSKPPFLNLRKEDYPGMGSDWGAPFIDALNRFGRQIQDSLASKLTFQENMLAAWKTIQVNGSDSPLARVSHGLSTPKISGVLVGAAYMLNGSARVPVSLGSVAFTSEGSEVKIQEISGMLPNTSYSLDLLIIAS